MKRRGFLPRLFGGLLGVKGMAHVVAESVEEDVGLVTIYPRDEHDDYLDERARLIRLILEEEWDAHDEPATICFYDDEKVVHEAPIILRRKKTENRLLFIPTETYTFYPDEACRVNRVSYKTRISMIGDIETTVGRMTYDLLPEETLTIDPFWEEEWTEKVMARCLKELAK